MEEPERFYNLCDLIKQFKINLDYYEGDNFEKIIKSRLLHSLKDNLINLNEHYKKVK